MAARAKTHSPPPRFVSTRALRVEFGLSPWLAYNAQRGNGPAGFPRPVKIGGNLYVVREALEGFLARQIARAEGRP